VLTGLLADRSAVSGVLAKFDALGVEPLELPQIPSKSLGSGDDRSPDWV
jgi:hypothetical protein